MSKLITNLKEVKLVANIAGLSLNTKEATFFEFNAYISYLLGFLTSSEVFENNFDINGGSAYRENSEVAVIDFFTNKDELNKILSKHNIVTVFDSENNQYISSKMKVDNGEIIADSKHLSSSKSDPKKLLSILLTLIDILEYEDLDKLAELKISSRK